MNHPGYHAARFTPEERLSPTQEETLLFVLETICARQRPPTWQEMMRRFGLSSPNAVTQRVDTLARKGWIECPPGDRSGGFQASALRVRGCSFRKAARGLAVVLEDSPEGWRLAELLSGRISLAKGAEPCPRR